MVKLIFNITSYIWSIIKIILLGLVTFIMIITFETTLLYIFIFIFSIKKNYVLYNVIIGISEETTRTLIFFPLLKIKKINMNTIISLSFITGLIEGIFYGISYFQKINIIFVILMHIFFHFFICLIEIKLFSQKKYIMLLIPILLHSIYDYYVDLDDFILYNIYPFAVIVIMFFELINFDIIKKYMVFNASYTSILVCYIFSYPENSIYIMFLEYILIVYLRWIHPLWTKEITHSYIE